MRIKLAIGRRESGSLLVTTVVLTAILVFTLGSYLWWARWQNLMVAQSQAWNAALAAAEAGIEDAMAQINVTWGTNYVGSARANWGGPAGGPYGPRTVVLTNASYSAIIIPASPGPTLIATGYATVPIVGKPVYRTVRVTTTATAAFTSGIAAQKNIVANGNNIMVDSYDSSDPAHSTPEGRYDPAKRKAGGDIATTEGAIYVGNANIFGHVYTAPWGNVSVFQNGRVGDLPPSPTYPDGWSGTSGIEDGWWKNDYNMDFKDTDPPDASGALPVQQNDSKSPGYATNSYTLGSSTYIVDGDFKVQNGETVYINGNATLWVQGNYTMLGGSSITIAPGYTLKVYVGTENTAAPVSANFTTVNSEGSDANAFNFQYYGLPSNTQLSWSGNASYMGMIYAPEAAFILSGSGSTATNDYQGSCVVRGATLNGHFNIHYDENLKHRGPVSGFTATSWREL